MPYLQKFDEITWRKLNSSSIEGAEKASSNFNELGYNILKVLHYPSGTKAIKIPDFPEEQKFAKMQLEAIMAERGWM